MWLTFTRLWQISVTLLKEDSLPLLRHMATTHTFLLNHLCRGGSASTTGTLGLDVGGKTHLRNKLRRSGILLPCKKRLTMLITIFFKNGFTWRTLRAARFSSIRTPSTLTSMSNLCTFMTQGGACQIKSSKVNKDGFCKEFSHVPHFVEPQSVVRSYFLCCLCISATSTPRRKASPRSSFSLFAPCDVAAETTSVLLTKPSRTVPCLRHWASPPLWWPGSIPDKWADVCGFLQPPGSQRCWKVNKYGAFSIPRKALGLRPNDQSCHHETWPHLDFVDWSNTWSNQDYYNGNIQKCTISRFVRTAHGQIHCWKRKFGLWHRSRFRFVVRIQIILAQDETKHWSDVESTG